MFQPLFDFACDIEFFLVGLSIELIDRAIEHLFFGLRDGDFLFVLVANQDLSDKARFARDGCDFHPPDLFDAFHIETIDFLDGGLGIINDR